MDKIEKASALIENMKNTAKAITTIGNRLYAMRKMPRICRKQKYSKHKHDALKFQLPLTIFSGAIQNAVIMSQPIHKFKSGGISGMIGDNNGPEKIFPNG